VISVDPRVGVALFTCTLTFVFCPERDGLPGAPQPPGGHLHHGGVRLLLRGEGRAQQGAGQRPGRSVHLQSQSGEEEEEEEESAGTKGVVGGGVCGEDVFRVSRLKTYLDSVASVHTQPTCNPC